MRALAVCLALATTLSLTATASAEPRRWSRFPVLSDSELTPEQRPIIAAILKIAKGGLNGPGNILVRSPKVYAADYQLRSYLMSPASGLTPRRRELIILVVARANDTEFEWWAHAPSAIAAGIPKEAVEDIRAGRSPRGLAADDQVVFDFLDRLLRNHRLSEADYGRAKDLLGERGMVDLIAFAGMYQTTALMLNATDTTAPINPANPIESLH